MTHQHFARFSDDARIWVHGFAHPLTAGDTEFIRKKLQAFLPAWKSHGRPVRADYRIVDDRFLITIAECPGGISGCSVDSFFRVLKDIQETSELNPLESDLVYFRDNEGKIQAHRHLDFYETVESGVITPETPVFDTLLQKLSDFRQGHFERLFSESWHSRTYPLPQETVNGAHHE